MSDVQSHSVPTATDITHYNPLRPSAGCVSCFLDGESEAVFLTEPPSNQFDLHFQLGGFPVRVTPFFWVAAAVLGHSLAAGFNRALGDQSPSTGVLLALWIVCVFLSILVHELGHALAMRFYGMKARIVLWHFGGLAVPESVSSFVSFGSRTKPHAQIVISAAGPAAQLLLAFAIVVGARLSGINVDTGVGWADDLIALVNGAFAMPQGTAPSGPVKVLLVFILWPSIAWALLNLLPIYPLDGGQIAREVFTIFSQHNGTRYSLMFSFVTALAVVFYGLKHDIFLAIMFGMLAYSSFQMLQMYSGRGGFGGGVGRGSPW